MPTAVQEVRVDVPEKTATAVRALANQETFREIGNLFGMNSGNSHRYIFEILKVNATTLKSTYIMWPTASECERIGSDFESVSSIPSFVGCIDNTHNSNQGTGC